MLLSGFYADFRSHSQVTHLLHYWTIQDLWLDRHHMCLAVFQMNSEWVSLQDITTMCGEVVQVGNC